MTQRFDLYVCMYYVFGEQFLKNLYIATDKDKSRFQAVRGQFYN